jgi:hypothetical protein
MAAETGAGHADRASRDAVGMTDLDLRAGVVGEHRRNADLAAFAPARLDRQPGLAGAARPGEGHQAGGGEQRADPLDLVAPADEAGQLGGQPGGPRRLRGLAAEHREVQVGQLAGRAGAQPGTGRAPAPHAIVRTLLDALPAGSYLLLSRGTGDGSPEESRRAVEIYHRRGIPCQTRNRAEVTALVPAGLEIVEPGTVLLHRWRPDTDPDEYPDAGVSAYCLIAHKRA